MKNKEAQFFDQIKKSSNILITGHSPWNEEFISNALALRLFLEKLGKKAEVAMENGKEKGFLKPSKEGFSIFPNFQEIKKELSLLKDYVVSLNISDTEIEKIKYKINENYLNFFVSLSKGQISQEDVKVKQNSFKYDLIIVLNTPDLELLGSLYKQNSEFFYNTPIINIDNQASNEEFGQINIIELTHVSVAETLYSLFINYGESGEDLLDGEIATSLLGSIIYKTKNFKTLVTPNVLHVTSQLISWGGNKEKIIDKFYRSRKLNVLKLWGRALNNLSSLRGVDNKLIWTTLAAKDFKETETTEKELIDLIDEIVIHIPNVNVVIVFYEKEREDKKVFGNFMIYSHKNINLKGLLTKYSPVGNEKILQARTSAPLNEIKKEVVASVFEEVKKLG